MRVLVTGSTGRIGRALLLQRPADIETEVLLDPCEQSDSDLPWYRADISDHDKTVMAITCAQPDMVVHLAAMTDVDRCERNPGKAIRVNDKGAGNVAEACSKCGAGMVFLSTDYVFNGLCGPYTETDKPDPINVYGLSKLRGERSAAKVLDKLAIVRISVPFGARMAGTAHNFISWLIEELSAGNAVKVVTDQKTTPAFLDELAVFLWQVIVNRIKGIIHYGTGDRLSRHEMAIELCRVMGYPETLVEPVKTADLHFFSERPLESGFVTGRAGEILNRPPVLFGEALKLMTGKGCSYAL
ncbi:MAG: SDR family oxidoreductase [Candidatus Latescibacterota bacterium]